MISRATIDELKGRLDIVDVVSDFVALKRAGQSYKGLSPFTNEKTPSFFVVPSKGIFKDFSSGKGGDAITFVMEHEGMSYAEAIRYLARKYGVSIVETEGPQQPDDGTQREALYIVLNFAKDYYCDLLNTHEEGRSIGRSYLRERGLNDAVIRNFELGYSLTGWDEFTRKALSAGFSQDILERAGLILKREGREPYDRFRGRIIFPVHNLTGKTIAFGARILTRPSGTKEKEQPKYVNSPETEVYQKGQVLYGLFQAKQAIRKEDFVYLVEGYTDVLSLQQAGIGNVVASSGTALTPDQIRLISRFTQHTTLLFDGDEAGVKAALRGVDLVLKGGLNVKVVVLPDKEDPDSYSRKVSVTELQEYLKAHARDFLSFKIELFADDAAHDPIRKAELIKDIVASIAVIPDPLKRTVYVQECARKLDVPAEVIAIEIKKLVLRQRKAVAAKEEAPGAEGLRSSLADLHAISGALLRSPQETLVAYEQEVIKVLLLLGTRKTLNDQKVYDMIFSETEDVNYLDPRHREIIDLYRAALAEGRSAEPDDFIQALSEELRNYVVGFIVQRYEISEGWKRHKIYVGDEYQAEQAPYKAIMQMKLGIVQKMLAENKEKLKTCTSKEVETGLMDIQYNIDQYKNTIGNQLGRHVFISSKLANPI